MPRPHQAHSITRRNLIRLATAAGAALWRPGDRGRRPDVRCDRISQGDHSRVGARGVLAFLCFGDCLGRLGRRLFERFFAQGEPVPLQTAEVSTGGDVEISAADALVETIPTMLAGMLAAPCRGWRPGGDTERGEAHPPPGRGFRARARQRGTWPHGDDMCDQGRGRGVQSGPETGANTVRAVSTLPHLYYRQMRYHGHVTNLTVSRSLADKRGLTYT
jgi:hypothetical protein